MAEPRRIELTTVEPIAPEKEEKKEQITFRFSLTLTDSTERTCPEFSYTELLKNALDKKKKPKQEGEEKDDGFLDPDDPFANQDAAEQEKMEAIAKAFEEKYAVKPAKQGKKARQRLDDLVDLGEGYDETDPFIDNSEAYDEIVPSCLTTKLGGFYINAGVLDFRQVSDSEDDEFKPGSSTKKKKKKINRIGSDSDEEVTSNASNESVKKKRGRKKKKLEDKVGGLKRKKMSCSSVEGEKPKKIKRLEKVKGEKKKKLTPTVAELLKQQTNSTSGGLKNDSNDVSSNELPNGTSDNNNAAASIDLTIEAVVSQARFIDGDSIPNPEKAQPLPPGLPDKILKTLDALKQAAIETEEGKCKFFSGEVNKMVLDVELQSRQLSCGIRSKMYEHLANFLPCSKETLLKRAKKLRLNQQDHQLREPIQKLKEAIIESMPVQLERYAQECSAVAQANKDKGEKEIKEVSTESDDDNSQPGEEKKRTYMPRKKFEWTNEIRKLLCDVATVKMHCYEVLKLRAQSPEEYLKAFLNAEITPLWPKGWMQTRMLFKESRSAHSSWTIVQKPKKPVLVTKPASSSTNVSVNASNTTLNVSNLNVSNLSTASKTSTPANTPMQIKTESKLLPPAGVSPIPLKEEKLTLLDYADRSYLAKSAPVSMKQEGESLNLVNNNVSTKVEPEPDTSFKGNVGKTPVQTSSLLKNMSITASILTSKDKVEDSSGIAEAVQVRLPEQKASPLGVGGMSAKAPAPAPAPTQKAPFGYTSAAMKQQPTKQSIPKESFMAQFQKFASEHQQNVFPSLSLSPSAESHTPRTMSSVKSESKPPQAPVAPSTGAAAQVYSRVSGMQHQVIQGKVRQVSPPKPQTISSSTANILNHNPVSSIPSSKISSAGITSSSLGAKTVQQQQQDSVHKHSNKLSLSQAQPSSVNHQTSGQNSYLATKGNGLSPHYNSAARSSSAAMSGTLSSPPENKYSSKSAGVSSVVSSNQLMSSQRIQQQQGGGSSRLSLSLSGSGQRSHQQQPTVQHMSTSKKTSHSSSNVISNVGQQRAAPQHGASSLSSQHLAAAQRLSTSPMSAGMSRKGMPTSSSTSDTQKKLLQQQQASLASAALLSGLQFADIERLASAHHQAAAKAHLPQPVSRSSHTSPHTASSMWATAASLADTSSSSFVLPTLSNKMSPTSPLMSMAAGYQNIDLSDLLRDSPPTLPTYPGGALSLSAAASSTVNSDAVISGPAPGTYGHGHPSPHNVHSPIRGQHSPMTAHTSPQHQRQSPQSLYPASSSHGSSPRHTTTTPTLSSLPAYGLHPYSEPGQSPHGY